MSALVNEAVYKQSKLLQQILIKKKKSNLFYF